MLRAIQEAAISRENSITDLLRRCKVLATRLGSRDFQSWVDLELNGYPEEAELPPYRSSDVESKGHFVGSFGRQLSNGPIPPSSIPERFRDRIRYVRMRQPISTFEDLLNSPTESGTFQAPWPADLVAHVGSNIYESMSCISAWQVVPRGLIVSVVDAVRNRILNFALEIEQIDPTAGLDASRGSISAETVTQVFHTHVYGNIGNMAAGSQQFSQAAQLTQGDFSALAKELQRLGFSKEETEDLQKAMNEDGNSSSGFGGRVAAWIGKGIAKAGEGALKVSTETALKLLPNLIAAHLGLPPQV